MLGKEWADVHVTVSFQKEFKEEARFEAKHFLDAMPIIQHYIEKGFIVVITPFDKVSTPASGEKQATY